MPARSILHLNIRVAPARLEECREFYCSVLGLVAGERPPFESTGFWLYAGTMPLVHLVAAADPGFAGATPESPLQHVAFDCSGLAAVLATLEAQGIHYRLSRVPLLGSIQIQLADPVGIGIELSFDPQEGPAVCASR